nr:uncharacterized protein LOC111413367 [Onthophagus taurus]
MKTREICCSYYFRFGTLHQSSHHKNCTRESSTKGTHMVIPGKRETIIEDCTEYIMKNIIQLTCVLGFLERLPIHCGKSDFKKIFVGYHQYLSVVVTDVKLHRGVS